MKRFTISHLLMLAAIFALLITLYRERNAHLFTQSCYKGVVGHGLVQFTLMPEEQTPWGPITIAGSIHLPLKMKLKDPKVVCSVLSRDGSRIKAAEGTLQIGKRAYGFSTHFAPGSLNLRDGLYTAQVEFLDGDRQLVLATYPLKIVEYGK